MENDEKQQDSQASESQEEQTEDSVETTESTSSSDVDYKVELEQARSLLAKKEKQIGQAEHVIETLKKEGTPVNTETIEEMIDKKFSEFTQKVRGDAIDSLVQSYAENQDEALLIKHHLEHTVKPSGDDITDILNAKALANKAKFGQSISELQRARQRTEPEQETTAGDRPQSAPKKRFSQAEIRLMKAFNLTAEDVANGVRK